MPRNGSGQYALPSGINPVLTQTLITSNWANTTLADVANALTQSLSRDGQTLPTNNLPMGGFIHTGVGNPVLRDNYASLGYIQDGSHYRLINVAGNNAISAVLPGGLTVYSLGMLVQLQPVANSTGPVSLNINGIGQVPVVTTAGNQLDAGDLLLGRAYMLMYNGIGFEMITGADASVVAQGTVSGAVRPGSGDYPLVTQFNATTVTVPGGTGFIVAPSARDSTDITEVTWATQNVVLTNLTQWVTWIGVDAGGSIVQLTGNVLPTAARSNIILAAVSHINGQINGISNRPAIYGDITYQAWDLSYVFNNILLTGGKVTPNAGNPMHMDLAAGVVWRPGGFANQINGPNLTPFLGSTAFSFFPVTGNNTVGAAIQAAPITNYDPAGAGAVVAIPGPANTAVIHRIYSISGQLIWLYGQTAYLDLNTAIREMAIDTALLKLPSNLQNATLLSLVIATKGTLNLGDTANCRLVPQGGTNYSIGVAGSVSEAPIDGSSYGRLNATWSKVVDAIINGDGITVDATNPNKPIVSLAATFAGPKTLTSGNFLLSATSDIRYSKVNFGIGALSVDAADNQGIQIYSGGAISNARGAYLEMFGNEHGNAGLVRLFSGAPGGIPAPIEMTGPTRLFNQSRIGGNAGLALDPTFHTAVIGDRPAADGLANLLWNPTANTTAGTNAGVGWGYNSATNLFAINDWGTAGAPARFQIHRTTGDASVRGGRLSGTALHNNASGIAGLAEQYVGSGTYTPTLTNVANGNVLTPDVSQFMRVGNVVTVSGRANISTSATATVTQIRVSLPIASNFALVGDCCGTGCAILTAASEPARIDADITNDAALLSWISQQVAAHFMVWQFTYVIK